MSTVDPAIAARFRIGHTVDIHHAPGFWLLNRKRIKEVIMAAFEGHWCAVARQATYGETPIRKVSTGTIADLVIEPNGRGHSFKKGLFGQKELPFTWIEEMPGGGYMDLGGGFFILFSYHAPDHLVTQWKSPMKSIDGMGIIYQRA